MDAYYKEIDLPIPVNDQILKKYLEEKNNGINTWMNLKPGYVYIKTNIRDDLNPDLVEIFDELNIFPCALNIQGHSGKIITRRTTHYVHSDMTIKDNTLVDVPFAINWELSNTESTVFWWNVNNASRIVSTIDSRLINHDWYIHGHGAHYTAPTMKTKDPKILGYDLLSFYRPIKNKAFLFNTSIPHSATYYSGNVENRVCFSLRFPLEQIPNWKIAVKIFSQQ